jgi:polysaccharide deacetylase 2 family uncharacterized protein YibQ
MLKSKRINLGNATPQLRVHVIPMNSHTPLWKRGARGDFINIILKSPLSPFAKRG